MKCHEILEVLDRNWPFDKALSWDNVGLLVGRREKEVKRIYVCLDVTSSTIRQAAVCKADLIISHHPMIFSAMKQITSDQFIGRNIIEMISNDIAYCAMHTNFDITKMADLNETCLELSDAEVLMITDVVDGETEGIGRSGLLPYTMTLMETAEFVKKKLQLPNVTVYGDLNKKLQRAAISGGAGKSMISYALESGAEVLVTGDIDHHTGIDAVEQGLCVIDAGHYGTEAVFIPYMQEQLQRLFPEISVFCAEIKRPFEVL